uniref:Uncharacterized protein n=1 Tax=Romanomermis culicivorax TaxID=13658 RepID=A0A915HWE3_ROMCU
MTTLFESTKTSPEVTPVPVVRALNGETLAVESLSEFVVSGGTALVLATLLLPLLMASSPAFIDDYKILHRETLPKEKEIIAKEIKPLEKTNIISKSISPCCTNVVLLGTLLTASCIRKSPYKSTKLDDQRRKHLHRNGAPEKDQNWRPIQLSDWSKGPKSQASAC